MEEVVVLCPAKINLFLNIIGFEDNLHMLHALNQSVDLYDFLQIKPNGTGKINITCNNPDVPTDERNSVYKTIELMRALFNIRYGFDVNIIKNIPLESGLGGESTDAAGTLFALNDICDLQLSKNDLCRIGFQIGCDVPFCLVGGTALINGAGDVVVEALVNFKHYVIVKPGFSCKTGEMFKAFDRTAIEYHSWDVVGIGFNDFEIIAPEIIQTIKFNLIEQGAIAANMSGSGSAVVGLFKNKKDQLKAYKMFKEHFESYKVDACDGVNILRKTRLN